MLMEQPTRRPTVFDILRVSHQMNGSRPAVDYVRCAQYSLRFMLTSSPPRCRTNSLRSNVLHLSRPLLRANLPHPPLRIFSNSHHPPLPLIRALWPPISSLSAEVDQAKDLNPANYHRCPSLLLSTLLYLAHQSSSFKSRATSPCQRSSPLLQLLAWMLLACPPLRLVRAKDKAKDQLLLDLRIPLDRLRNLSGRRLALGGDYLELLALVIPSIPPNHPVRRELQT
jgi:hypothetical protein